MTAALLVRVADDRAKAFDLNELLKRATEVTR